MVIDKINKKIIDHVLNNPNMSSSEIHSGLDLDIGLVTIKRRLSKCVALGFLQIVGVGRATKYTVHPGYKLFYPYEVEAYFQEEVDERIIHKQFNLDLISKILPSVDLVSRQEREAIKLLQEKYKHNVSRLPETVYRQELDRLGIDLSWKSSQIEGNTYSLLETEQLLKDHLEARGKKKEEAQMLLNHKIALDYIIENSDYFKELTVSKIEEVHRLLVKDLGIDPNIRETMVGITGTNYRPLDNKFQIKEALIEMCQLVNAKQDVFEKTLLVLSLISYIQPFSDGNKRTARLISNAILLSWGACPLSFRSVDPIDYKKALLLFYEQNSLQAFKSMLMDQYEFAVNTYF
ncbi:MAG: Fic family protein [Candidatus Marinimicrobia bacterium]|nr:Fic family protein [Candidatus Neomarinimicrobiota bacterium]